MAPAGCGGSLFVSGVIVRVTGILWVAVAGALGAVARYGLTVLLAQRVNSAFPWATLGINLAGSFALAFLSRLLLERAVPPALRLAVTTGFLGAFTTFSTFTWELLWLGRERRVAQAVAYAAVSVLAGLFLAWLGYGLAGYLTGYGPAGVREAPRAAPVPVPGSWRPEEAGRR